jgi:hypothetical protein
MASGVFLDRSDPPTHEALEVALASTAGWWMRIERWIGATYGVTGEPLFYGKESGWATRYRRGGKSLVTLLPMHDALRAVVVIGPSAAAGMNALRIQPETLAAFERARPYPDGRWLELPIASEADVDDLLTLISHKSPPPRRPRSSVPGR